MSGPVEPTEEIKQGQLHLIKPLNKRLAPSIIKD